MAEIACLQCMSSASDWSNSTCQPFLSSNWHFWQMVQMSVQCLLCKTEKAQISGQMQIICTDWQHCWGVLKWVVQNLSRRLEVTCFLLEKIINWFYYPLNSLSLLHWKEVVLQLQLVETGMNETSITGFSLEAGITTNISTSLPIFPVVNHWLNTWNPSKKR